METMTQEIRRAAISQLVEVMRDRGSWTGETHVQKCVYFMQGLLEVQMGYDFVLYKHGPYSFDLRNELAAMMASLELDVNPRYPYGPSFVLGHRSMRHVKLPIPVKDAIQFVGENLSPHDTRALERLATALFLQRSNSDLEGQDIASKIHGIKPHISVSDALSAIRDVAQLRDKMPAGIISDES